MQEEAVEHCMAEQRDTLIPERPELLSFGTRARNRELAGQLAAQARRSMTILTPDLEAPVYDSADIIAAIGGLALRGRFCEVRILVGDSGYAVRHGHRLIETARRFTSTVHMHRPAPQHRDFSEGFMVVDESGYLHKPVANRYEGKASLRDRLHSRELLRHFQPLWDLSVPDPELRRLHI